MTRMILVVEVIEVIAVALLVGVLFCSLFLDPTIRQKSR